MSGFFAKKRQAWEELCLRCGICCYEKEHHGLSVTINLDKPCDFLNIDQKTCSVYNERFIICKNCEKVTMFHALFSRYLPESCGYVKKYRPWRRFLPTIKGG